MNLIGSALELDDIQSGVLRPRPTPYAAAYVLFRIDEVKAGRELMPAYGPWWHRLHTRRARRATPG